MAQLEQPKFPWSEKSPIKGNLAIGNLRENINRLLTDTRGIHVETLLAAIGTISGYASQYAFLITNYLTPETIPETGLGSQLVVVRLKSGERLFFGDGINSYLAGGIGPTERLFLWGFVQGALVEFGLPLDEHPNVRTMFSRVSKAMGTNEFGIPGVPANHRPRASAVELTKLLWPHAQAILKLRPPSGVDTYEDDLNESDWPFISFIVAGQLMRLTRDHVPPDVAATLVMESAIVASKLDLSTTSSRVG